MRELRLPNITGKDPLTQIGELTSYLRQLVTELNLEGAQGKVSINEKAERGPEGKRGANGRNGISATHSWDGTVLTITSASGTSSADLKGEKGDDGAAIAVSGFITMSVDEDGNLYVHSSGDGGAPEFEYDEETGDLYYLT